VTDTAFSILAIVISCLSIVVSLFTIRRNRRNHRRLDAIETHP
jgi:hypothetical protein